MIEEIAETTEYLKEETSIKLKKWGKDRKPQPTLSTSLEIKPRKQAELKK